MLTSFVSICNSHELDVEVTVQDISGVTKRATASLIHNEDMRAYLVVTNLVFPDGRNMSLVDARRLESGGQTHSQVRTCTHEKCNNGVFCLCLSHIAHIV